ncbi:hypothetical protein M9X92_012038 [Pyricularia oryzae]|nr:hypothetical protein M9X92_012038 [Pyricularia oryzae]
MHPENLFAILATATALFPASAWASRPYHGRIQDLRRPLLCDVYIEYPSGQVFDQALGHDIVPAGETAEISGFKCKTVRGTCVILPTCDTPPEYRVTSWKFEREMSDPERTRFIARFPNVRI